MSLQLVSTVLVRDYIVKLLLQLRKQLALEAERRVEVEQTDTDHPVLIPHWCTTEEPLHLISILRAYSDLGFHPSLALLAAAEPFLSSVRSPIPLEQTLHLITLFRSFAWQPGQINARCCALNRSHGCCVCVKMPKVTCAG